MSAPAAQVIYGNPSVPLLIARKPRENREGLDTLSLTYVCDDEYAFREGNSAPGYSGMEILSVDKIDLSGGLWELTLDCEGVLLGKAARRKKDGLRETDPIGDWDTYADTWITTNANHFTKGQRAGNFVCINIDRQQLSSNGLWWEVTGQFAGLKAIRQPTRVITVNGQVVSNDRLRVALEGGWNDFRKGQASFPRVVVTDTQHTTVPPATANSPGNRVPLNAPPIRNITFSGSDLRAVWPKGWSFTPGGRQPFGLDVNLWIVENTYEWNLANLPA